MSLKRNDLMEYSAIRIGWQAENVKALKPARTVWQNGLIIRIICQFANGALIVHPANVFHQMGIVMN